MNLRFAFREIFVKPNNELYQTGDRMTRVKLARTLRLVSEQGIDTFYNGQLAEKIVAEIQHRGIDLEDIQLVDLFFQVGLSLAKICDNIALISLEPHRSI